MLSFCELLSVAHGLLQFLHPPDWAAEKSTEEMLLRMMLLFSLLLPKIRSMETFPANSYADFKVKRRGCSRRFFPGKKAKT